MGFLRLDFHYQGWGVCPQDQRTVGIMQDMFGENGFWWFVIGEMVDVNIRVPGLWPTLVSIRSLIGSQILSPFPCYADSHPSWTDEHTGLSAEASSNKKRKVEEGAAMRKSDGLCIEDGWDTRHLKTCLRKSPAKNAGYRLFFLMIDIWTSCLRLPGSPHTSKLLVAMETSQCSFFTVFCWLGGVRWLVLLLWGVPKTVVPQNGWFVMENPTKFGWFRGTPILETPLMGIAVYPRYRLRICGFLQGWNSKSPRSSMSWMIGGDHDDLGNLHT